MSYLLAGSLVLNLIFAVIFTADFIDLKQPGLHGHRFDKFKLWLFRIFGRTKTGGPVRDNKKASDTSPTLRPTVQWKIFWAGLFCGLVLSFAAAYLFGFSPSRQGRFVLIQIGGGQAIRMDNRTGQTWYIWKDTETLVKSPAL